MPSDRARSDGETSSAGKRRSTSTFITSRPTLPVAPTTADFVAHGSVLWLGPRNFGLPSEGSPARPALRAVDFTRAVPRFQVTLRTYRGRNAARTIRKEAVKPTLTAERQPVIGCFQRSPRPYQPPKCDRWVASRPQDPSASAQRPRVTNPEATALVTVAHGVRHWPSGIHADARVRAPSTTCAAARATCSSPGVPVQANRRCSARCATWRSEEMAVAGADWPRSRQRRRPDHPFVLRIAPRLIRSEDIRRGRNGAVMRPPEAARHRRGVDGALRSHVGHRSVATRRIAGVRASPSAACACCLFGDLHQLPPVVQEAEVATHLEEEFGGPFFFLMSLRCAKARERRYWS